MSGIVRVYHGSKGGIQGDIAPASRSKCDFGRGFYMGTERTQPLTLVCGYGSATLYTLDFDMRQLSSVGFEADLEWALFVAYNRGALGDARGTSLYERCAHLADGVDVIVGPIANDRMFVVLDRFFGGQITDIALVESLAALKLGQQYVAKTKRACERIAIVEEHVLSVTERQNLMEESDQNRKKGIALAEGICRKYRREGRFFDEIVAGETR